MKNLNFIILIVLFISTAAFSQTTNHRGKVKISNTPIASSLDSVVAIDTYGLIKKTQLQVSSIFTTLGGVLSGNLEIQKSNPRFTLDRENGSGSLALFRYYDDNTQVGAIGYNYDTNKFIYKDQSANDIFSLDRNGSLSSGDILNIHDDKWFTIRNGGNIGSGRQYLFMDVNTWSTNNSGANVNNANNFHYYDTGLARVEFETDNELQFYIEGGVGHDAWYGLQEGSTHRWSFGSDASHTGALNFSTGFGLSEGSNKFTLTTSGSIGQGVLSPNAFLHSRLGTTGFLHQPIVSHKNWLFEHNNDATIQLSSNNAGTVGTAFIFTNQESSNDGRHWVVEHTGLSDNNIFGIGYKQTTT